MTREYIIEHGLATEAEIEEIDVDAMVHDYGWEEGDVQNTLIFDLDLQAGYFGENRNLLLKDVIPTKEKALSIEEIEAIKALIDSESITEWKPWYRGTSEGTTGSFSWTMYIELEDSRGIKYGGNGVSGESTPENYDEFVTGLQAFFEEQE